MPARIRWTICWCRDRAGWSAPRQPGGLNWQVVPDITSSIYPMMQYIDAELETRTGLSRQSQGIDANALQNQSATAVAQMFSASQMRMKLIARIMAEGVRDIFALLHGTIRKHGQSQQTVRLRNTWVAVDPRAWKTREDMTINVGLGSGGKLLVWDKVLGLGTTDPLAGFAAITSNLVVSFYFAKRGFENVARILKR